MKCQWELENRATRNMLNIIYWIYLKTLDIFVCSIELLHPRISSGTHQFMHIFHPHQILHFFNTPPSLSEDQLVSIFNHKEVSPIAVRMFPLKTERSSSGLIEFPSVAEAVIAIMKCNHIPVENKGDYCKRPFFYFIILITQKACAFAKLFPFHAYIFRFFLCVFFLFLYLNRH